MIRRQRLASSVVACALTFATLNVVAQDHVRNRPFSPRWSRFSLTSGVGPVFRVGSTMPSTALGNDIRLGARLEFFGPMHIVLHPELGYHGAFETTNTRVFLQTGMGLGWGGEAFTVELRSNLLLGSAHDALAIGMRNGLRFSFLWAALTVDLAHQFYQNQLTGMEHDVVLMVSADFVPLMTFFVGVISGFGGNR